MELSSEELRVLGCLIEKSHTTPEHYPLTTNALVSACNQKSSRDPIVTYSARQVDEVSTELRAQGLARTVRGTGMRTHKHKHVVDEALGLSDEEQATLAVLILRGPQSAGEVKTRTERYVNFEDLAAVEEVLARLASRGDPFVVNIGRESGQSQDRWRHLLAATGPATTPQVSVETAPADHTNRLPPNPSDQNKSSADAGPVSATPANQVENDPASSAQAMRIQALENRVSFLEEALGVESSE